MCNTGVMKRKKQFHANLATWYKENGRKDLPWRHTSDPYHILVSEMMLQQTQVQTVLDRYYQPFLERFPSLDSIAKANLEEVMQLWQGLGYYRRAKFLHQSAIQSAPKLPTNVEGLMALPGIGRNTAHAVLAFAHHKPHAVMEANVKRVLSRIFRLSEPKEKELWQLAEEILNREEPFDYNQAMMDVGATICKPSSPLCGECPANVICLGKDNPTAYPAPKKAKQVPVRKQQVLVVRDSSGLIYSKARDTDFLHGLHQFVELEEHEDVIELNGKLYTKKTWNYLGEVSQTYSHFKQQAEVFLLEYKGSHAVKCWQPLTKLKALPMSKKEEKILALLAKKYPAN